jgi:hypothetical protein
MSIIKPQYGTQNQPFTCTFTSLANNGARSSTPVDNTADLALDALVQVKVKTSASALVTPYVNVYAYGTADGSTYGGGEANMGTDAAVTLTSPPNIRLIGTINTPAVSTTYVSGPFSVAAAFGGVLPEKWGIVIENKTGQALDASVGSAWYQELQAQLV